MGETYNKRQINKKMKNYEGWNLGDDGMLHKTITFDDFAHAMLFANAVGHLAEDANHHPDLFVHGYKNLRISLMSHDVGGITDRDFALIEAIETLA